MTKKDNGTEITEIVMLTGIHVDGKVYPAGSTFKGNAKFMKRQVEIGRAALPGSPAAKAAAPKK